MVILKNFDFNELPVNNSLSIFGASTIRSLNLDTSYMTNITFRFEVAMYWAIYHYDNKINNIVDFQQFVMEQTVKYYVGFISLERTIKEYLGVKK